MCALQEGLESMLEFEREMETRFMNKKLKFIVDGANVAYCQQNFAGGGFSYKQIDVVLERLVS